MVGALRLRLNNFPPTIFMGFSVLSVLLLLQKEPHLTSLLLTSSSHFALHHDFALHHIALHLFACTTLLCITLLGTTLFCIRRHAY